MKKVKSERQIERRNAVIAYLKSLIFPVILCLIILVGILVVINYSNVKETPTPIEVRGYDGGEEPVILENDKLKLTMDPLTTQFSLLVKDTGKVWYSNPEDADADPVALSMEKGRLKSTLLMSYCSAGGMETMFNSYDKSVAKGLYEIEATDDMIRVYYTIGDQEREYRIPPASTVENFESWIGKMDAQTASKAKNSYKLYDINKLGKSDDKEALLEKYPSLESQPLYIIRDNRGPVILQTLEQAFEAVGYDAAALEADKELVQGTSGSTAAVFNITMQYRLDGDSLVVEFPISEMEFNKDNPLYTLTPLPYFGAGGTDDEGYLVVPEGGGALINFNNQKTAQNAYYANLYGWDMALSRESVVHSTEADFNAFGIINGDSSFLCLLEEGAPYVSIKADVSGKSNSYNYAQAVYSITNREQYSFSQALTTGAVFVYQESLPDETLTQRYRFIDSGSYVDMAKDYQEYLKERWGDRLALQDETQAPVSVEILGAVDKVKQILGVPVSRPLELTTYSEAADLITRLHGEGMTNLSVKLSGWCNGGVRQKYLKKVKTISALGSKKDLQKLVDTAESMGVGLYLDGSTQYAKNSGILDGFFSYSDAAKFISKERAEIYQYSTVTFAQRESSESYYLLHTDLTLEAADKLAEYAKGLGAGVSFQEVGSELSSDFYLKDMNSRQAVLNKQVSQLQEMSDSGMKIMVNKGFDYVIPYSDIVTNMALQGSEYTILDEFIPFYQIALHGYVDYTGKSLNLSDDYREELLRSAEYGAGLQFTFMDESAFTLQKTLYSEYFGAEFDAWHDRMMEIYDRYNAELGHVFGQEMTGHEILSEELTCTTYADGTKVYVNYGYEDISVPSGVTVPARDYAVVR